MKLRKALCWILVLAMVMNFAPAPVFATGVQNDTVEQKETESTTDEKTDDTEKTGGEEKATEYGIIVNGATASVDKAIEGTKVTLTKNIPDGKVFEKWEVSEGVCISGDSFVMPKSNVTITAVYKDTEELNQGGNSNDNQNPDFQNGDTIAKEYSITITDGTANIENTKVAKAKAGATVSLIAKEAEAGKVFEKWEVSEGVEIIGDSFIMPAKDVQVKAVFKRVESTPMLMSVNQPEKKVLNAQSTKITTPLVFTETEDQSGVGYNWVASTKTLTLNNVDISVSSTAITVPADATIVLEGQNKIYSNDDGIIVATEVNTDTLTIKGTGNLDIQAKWYSIYTRDYPGHAAGLTIESGTIKVNREIQVGNTLRNIGGNVTGTLITCKDLITEGGEITASNIVSDENASINGGRVKCNGDFKFGNDGWGHNLTIKNGKLVVNGQIYCDNLGGVYDMDRFYLEGPGAFIQKNDTNLKAGGIVRDDDSDLDLTNVTSMTVMEGASFTINDCSKFKNITFKNIGSINLPTGSTEYSINLSPESIGKLLINGVEIGKDRKEVTYKDLSGQLNTVKATPLIDKLEKETLGSGWYVVEDTKTLKDLVISGNVNLILADDCTLNVNQAFMEDNRESFNFLTIWGGEKGTGKAFIRGNGENKSLYIGYNNTMTINGGTIEVTGNEPICMANANLIVNNGYLKAVSSVTGEGSFDISSFQNNQSKLEIGENGTVEANKIFVQYLYLGGKLIGNGLYAVNHLFDANRKEIYIDAVTDIVGPILTYSGYNKLTEFREDGIQIEGTFEGKKFLFRKELIHAENSEGTVLTEVIEPGDYIAVYGEKGSEIKIPFKVKLAEITGDIIQTGELTYDGGDKTAQITNNLKARGNNAITVKYGTKKDECNSTSVPAFRETGEHVVYYKATASNHNEKVGSFTVKINKAPTEFENGIKAYKDNVEKTEFTYGDTIIVKAKPIIKGTAPVSADGKMRSMFSLFRTAPALNQMALFVGNVQISDPVSAGKDGYYVMTLNTTDELVRAQLKLGEINEVTVRFAGSTYLTEAEGTISLKVNKATITVKSESNTVNYGDEIPKYTATYSGFINGETFEQTITGEPAFDCTYVKNSDVGGDYVIYPKPGSLASDRYTFSYEATGKVTVNKVKAAITTDPKAVTDLVYTAEVKKLVTAGTTNDGEIVYSLNNKDFAKELPTAVNAGNYTVYYKVVGDKNHTDSEVKELSNITIQRANLTADMFTATNLTHTYDGTEKKPVVTLKSENKDKGVGTITVNTSGVKVADSKNEISFCVAEGANYNAADLTMATKFTINRATPDRQMFVISENIHNYDGKEHTAIVASKADIEGMGVITVKSTATNVADNKAVEISVAEGANYKAANIQFDEKLIIKQKELTWNISDLTAGKRQNDLNAPKVYGKLAVNGIIGNEVIYIAPDTLKISSLSGKQNPGMYEGQQLEGNIGSLDGANKVNYKLPDELPTITVEVTKVEELPKPNIPVDPNDPNKQYKLESEEGISSVPDAIKKNEELNSPEKIETKMKVVLTDQKEEIPETQKKVVDVDLMISTDDGKSWKKAEQKNFPEKGLAVTIPYPEGTGKDSHNFIVAHMFTQNNGEGKNAGDIEYPVVTKTEYGLQFTVSGLSPISVGWKEAPKPVVPDANDSNNSNDNVTNEAGNDADSTPTVVPAFDGASVRIATAKLADGSSYEAKVSVEPKKPVTKTDESKESNTEEIESEEETAGEEVKETTEETAEETTIETKEMESEDLEVTEANPVEKGNASWMWILLVAVIAAAGGFYFWKKKQKAE